MLGLMRRLPAGMELTSEATQYTCCPPLMPPTDPATHNTVMDGLVTIYIVFNTNYMSHQLVNFFYTYPGKRSRL